MELFEAHFSQLDGSLCYDSTDDSYTMFGGKGVKKHLTYLTFKELFKQMNGRRDLTILETGVAAYGTRSTYLFNEYVRKYGGRFWSVDINPKEIVKHLSSMCPATTLVYDDSVHFLTKWVSEHQGQKADVVFLDSFDLDYSNPQPSADHGLKEYVAVLPALQEGSLLLIDDTPATPYWLDFRGPEYDKMTAYYNTHGRMPGKGMYVLDFAPAEAKLLHNFQVLYKF